MCYYICQYYTHGQTIGSNEESEMYNKHSVTNCELQKEIDRSVIMLSICFIIMKLYNYELAS